MSNNQKRLALSASARAVATAARWDRANLYLTVSVVMMDEELSFVLDGGAGKRVKLHVLSSADGVYELHVNITNNGYDRCVDPGEYRMRVFSAAGTWANIAFCDALCTQLTSLSGVFAYAAKQRAHAVFFEVQETDEGACAVMFVRQVVACDIHGNPTAKRQRLSLKASRWFLRTWYGLKCPRSKQGKPHVLFATEQDDHLRPNLQAVHERMLERGLDERFSIDVSCRAASNKGRSWGSWLRTLNTFAKADTVLIDNYVDFLDWLELDAHTTLIQLWHSGFGFKAAGYARWGLSGAPKPFNCYRQTDYAISTSRRTARLFAEEFGIVEERVLPTGMPRIDDFLAKRGDEGIRNALLDEFPVCKGRKVILFAPTFRGRKVSAFYPYDAIDFDRLAQVCGQEYAVLFKMHPWVKEPVPIPERYASIMADATAYPQINDLFYITDLLVTDYSSNIFEFSLLGKPMLFYAFDEGEYAATRGFFRPYEQSAPGKVCRSFEELASAIEAQEFDMSAVEAYAADCFDCMDTNSTDRVIDWLLLGKMPQDYALRIQAQKDWLAYLQTLEFGS